jgi:hypothetical protein
MDSWYTDQAFETTLLSLLDTALRRNIRYPAIVKYNPMFVTERDKLPKIGASRLIKFLISN